MNSGEVTQPFLLQQLGNPNASPRDRETLLATLNFFNHNESIQNVMQAQMASANHIGQHQQPQNTVGNPIQPLTGGAHINHDILQSQHMFMQHQASAAQKQQLRISPLPNGKIIRNNYNNIKHIIMVEFLFLHNFHGIRHFTTYTVTT